MLDIMLGDLIKIKNREAIYSSEMDMDSEYVVLDIWREDRELVLKVKKCVNNGSTMFSEHSFTVRECHVEKNKQ